MGESEGLRFVLLWLSVVEERRSTKMKESKTEADRKIRIHTLHSSASLVSRIQSPILSGIMI